MIFVFKLSKLWSDLFGLRSKSGKNCVFNSVYFLRFLVDAHKMILILNEFIFWKSMAFFFATIGQMLEKGYDWFDQSPMVMTGLTGAPGL